MARPVEYDRSQVLEQAMGVFWAKGYEAASMAEILDATGLTSRSLYNIFGSKNGLFKEVLTKYYEFGFGPALTKLENGTGLAAIRQYIDFATNGEPVNGCLFVNTLSDHNCVEPDSLEMVRQFFEKLETAFRKKFEYARKNEGYTGAPALRARQLVVFLHGLAVYSKLEISPQARRKMTLDFITLIGV